MLKAIAGPYSTREHEATQQSPTAALVTEIRMGIARILTKIRTSEELIAKIATVDIKCPSSRFRKTTRKVIILGEPCAGRCTVGFDLKGNPYQIYGTVTGDYSLESESEYNLMKIRCQVEAIEITLSHS